MATLTETSIFNDTDAPNTISVWAANHLTAYQPVCVKPRSFDFVFIGRPTDTRWYAYENLTHDNHINERVELSKTGWVKVDLGMWAPPAYVWLTQNEPMVALPGWDDDAAKTLGVDYDEWRDIMRRHATRVLQLVKQK